jgi:hypothetical protein
VCTVFFSNQISKCVTFISRTFMKYYEHFTFFWHFTLRNDFIQNFEDIQWSSESNEKISNWKKQATFLFITEEAREKSGRSKEEITSKGKEIENINSPISSGLQV